MACASTGVTYPKYVVLIGDVGTGKSTVVEKMTGGVLGRSSDAKESVTKETTLFWSQDKRLVVADTPGANSMGDKLSHNTQIAWAFNYAPVSKVFTTVKADTRLDNVVDDVRKYAEQLGDLDLDVIGVIVTHMDTVKWSKVDFLSALHGELGISDTVFTGIETDGRTLTQDVLKVCKKTFPLYVDGNNFFKLFKISNNNMKILRSCKKQVDLFKSIKEWFDRERTQFPQNLQADLAFEFQAFMNNQIVEAQKAVEPVHLPWLWS